MSDEFVAEIIPRNKAKLTPKTRKLNYTVEHSSYGVLIERGINEENKKTGDDVRGYSHNVGIGCFEQRCGPGQQLQHQRIGDHVPTVGHTSEARASEGLQVGGPAVNRQERRTFAVLVIARKMPNIFRGQGFYPSCPFFLSRRGWGVLATPD
jgi:hypothetical protein